MSVITTISVQAADFVLGETLTSHPDVTVRLERIVPLDDRRCPYLWIGADDVQSIAETIRTELDVESVEVVAIEEDETLVRVEWVDPLDSLVDTIVQMDGTVLEGRGSADRWHLTLRFDGRGDVSGFYRECADRGIRVTVESVHDPAASHSTDLPPKLTDGQRRVLSTAHEAGYFNVPRDSTMDELAAELGVSDTAVSQQLRRALARLVERAVLELDTSTHADEASGIDER